MVCNTLSSQFGSNRCWPFVLMGEHAEDVAYAIYFIVWARHEDDMIRLKRFSFASDEHVFRIAIARDQHSAPYPRGP
jgi:hypothetical protein